MVIRSAFLCLAFYLGFSTATFPAELVDQLVTIKTHSGRWVRAGDTGEVNLQTFHGPWEEFYIRDRGDGKYAIQTAHGQYLKAEPGQFKDIKVEPYIGAWEQFTFRAEAGGVWAIGTAHGTYLRAQDNHNVDTQLGIGPWEKFTIALVNPPAPTPAPTPSSTTASTPPPPASTPPPAAVNPVQDAATSGGAVAGNQSWMMVMMSQQLAVILVSSMIMAMV